MSFIPVVTTIEEIMKNIKEAIETHLLFLKEEKEEVTARDEFAIGRVQGPGKDVEEFWQC